MGEVGEELQLIIEDLSAAHLHIQGVRGVPRGVCVWGGGG